MNYAEKLMDYQSRHNLRNPLTKMKTTGVRNRGNSYMFTTALGTRAVAIAIGGISDRKNSMDTMRNS